MTEIGNHEFVVESVNISSLKGTAKAPVSRIVIDEMGVVDDAHRGNGGRSVSLLSRNLMDELEVGSSMEIENGQMGENITFRMSGSGRFRIGDRIAIGDVLLLVTAVGKKCHGERCAIYRKVGRCVMPDSGLFCSVLRGGTIRPGASGSLAPETLLT